MNQERKKLFCLVECSPVLGPGPVWVTGQDRKWELTADRNEARIFDELTAFKVAQYVRDLGYQVQIRGSSNRNSEHFPIIVTKKRTRPPIDAGALDDLRLQAKYNMQ